MKRLLIKFSNTIRANPMYAMYKLIRWFIKSPYYYCLYPWILYFKIKLRDRRISYESIKDLDTFVVSPGGVATTTMISFFSNYVTVNDPHDRDLLKHINSRHFSDIFKKSKVIYIYGDPQTVFDSLRKRGWLHEQYIKLGGKPKVFYSDKLLKHGFIKLVEEQIDFFNVLRGAHVKILLIHYNEIWEKKLEIKEFLGVEDVKFLSEFPKRKVRNAIPY